MVTRSPDRDSSFADLSHEFSSTGNERGLLSLTTIPEESRAAGDWLILVPRLRTMQIFYCRSVNRTAP